MRRPQMLDLPRPRREEYTICTAVAPEDAFTVRTYGDTRTHYGQAPPASAQIPRRSRPNVQVRKLQPAKPRNADKSRGGDPAPGRSGRRRTRHRSPVSGALPRLSGTWCCTPGTGPGPGERPRGAGRGTGGGGPALGGSPAPGDRQRWFPASVCSGLPGQAGEQGAGLRGQRHHALVLVDLQCLAQAGFGLVERPGQPVHLGLRHQELGP
jgi:hypothetical protein